MIFPAPQPEVFPNSQAKPKVQVDQLLLDHAGDLSFFLRAQCGQQPVDGLDNRAGQGKITIYIDAAIAQLCQEGFEVRDKDLARLSPLGFEHINMLGCYIQLARAGGSGTASTLA